MTGRLATLRDQLAERVTLASRITLLTTVAVGVTLAVVSLSVYVTVRSEVTQASDDALLSRAYAVAATTEITAGGVQTSLRGVDTADIEAALVVAEPGATEPKIIRQPDAAPMAALGDAEMRVAEGIDPSSLRTVTTDGTSYRVVAVQATDTVALVLAQSTDSTDHTLEKLGLLIWIIALAGVVVAAVAGWAVATNALRPVRRLTAAAERVATTEQLSPIEVSGHDELARLTVAFNSMLLSLDASKERQRRLVADAGHELRTPLTSLRTNIELLSQAESRSATPEGGLSPRARGELMTDVRAQLGELTTLVGDLVELARDEPPARDPEVVDLGDVLEASVQKVRLRAPGIEFDVVAEPWTVSGEPSLLERAVTNLLDNAAKWSPPLGTVTVRLRDGRLRVDDQGPGIAEEDRPHVFERFWRSREARMLPGSGLGLAIVAQAAERHGGTVRVGTAPGGGASFELALPAGGAVGDAPREAVDGARTTLA